MKSQVDVPIESKREFGLFNSSLFFFLLFVRPSPKEKKKRRTKEKYLFETNDKKS